MMAQGWLSSRWWDIAFGLAVGSLLASALNMAWRLATRRPAGQPVVLVTPTPARILVHVAGAVARPGVYELPPGSRVHDALEAAGGALPQAQLEALNLAQPLQDGQRLWVPRRGEPSPTPQPSPSPPSPTTPGPSLRLNLNTATAEELEALPGIGPVLARRIVAYREQNGPFRSVDELLNVKGIGPAVLEKLRPYVYVEPTP